MVSGGGKRANGSPEGRYPSSRTLVWRSNTAHEKSRHLEVIKSLSTAQQVELCLPFAAGHETAQQLRWHSAFYYEFHASIAALLSPKFIQEYIQQGSVSMILKNTPIDSHNTAMLLPTGELLLLVDANVYSRLGVVGSRYGQRGPVPPHCSVGSAKDTNSRRYIIQLNLHSEEFTSENPKHVARRTVIQDNLRKVFPPVDMIMCAFNERGVCRTINVDDNEIQTTRQRVNVDGSTDLLKDIFVPHFDAYFNPASNTDTSLRDSVHQTQEWLGLVSCRVTELLQRVPPHEYVSSYTGVDDPFEFTTDQLSCVRWRGYLHPLFCESVFEKAQENVRSGSIPWAALTVWGFPDVIVSWMRDQKKSEHGYLVNGSNMYTILLLPGDNYILTQTLGPHDTTV